MPPFFGVLNPNLSRGRTAGDSMTEKPKIFFHKSKVDPRNARSSHFQSQADEYRVVEPSALGVLLLSGSQSPYGQRFDPIQNDPYAGKHGKATVQVIGPRRNSPWGGSRRGIFPESLPEPIGITPNRSFGNNLTKKIVTGADSTPNLASTSQNDRERDDENDGSHLI